MENEIKKEGMIININENELYDTAMKWHHENGFWLTSGNERLAKIIAHWIFINVAVQGKQAAGDIIECGVFKAASLIQWAAYRNFMAMQDSRKLIAFDAFGAFQSLGDGAQGDDIAFVNSFEKEAGQGISTAELDKVLANKGIKNYELVPGDICETLPKYLASRQELRIALLHIDVDVYKPTYACLEHAYDRVVKDGVIVFDDYRKVPGATRAIEHFFKNRKMPMTLHQLPFSDIAFMVKG